MEAFGQPDAIGRQMGEGCWIGRTFTPKQQGNFYKGLSTTITTMARWNLYDSQKVYLWLSNAGIKELGKEICLHGPFVRLQAAVCWTLLGRESWSSDPERFFVCSYGPYEPALCQPLVLSALLSNCAEELPPPHYLMLRKEGDQPLCTANSAQGPKGVVTLHLETTCIAGRTVSYRGVSQQ